MTKLLGKSLIAPVAVILIATILLGACEKRPDSQSEPTATLAPQTPAQGSKNMDDLIKDGYKCENFGVGGFRCTKGDSVYLCDRKSRKCVETSEAPGGGTGVDPGVVVTPDFEALEEQQQTSEGTREN